MIKSKNTAILSQINSPIPPGHLYSRDRLLKLLKEENKLILVCSPAGYGKTTLVLDYLKSSSLKYGWVNISETTEHVFSFFQVIIAALQRANPDFGEDTMQLLLSYFEKNKFNTGWKEAINDIVYTFRKEFNNSFTTKTALILDDYHHIENREWKDYATEALTKNLPDFLQLIITSRQVPEIDFSNFVINNMMLKIEMEDLIFNKSEAAELISRKYKVPFKADRLDEIIQNLGGWITGLHLLMQGFGDSFENAEIDEQPIPENIFDFLADKIFANLDDESRELLLTTSVIENFDSGLCTSIGIKNFDTLMPELLKNHTFIVVVPLKQADGSEIVSYTYQRLFQNYITQKLYSLKSPDEIKNILRGTYKYYLDKDDTVTAIKYMIRAGDQEIALEHINKIFQSLFNEGKIEFLWEWMNSIREDLINASPESLIRMGVLKKFYSGDLQASVNYYNRAIEMLKDSNDYKLLFYAYVNKAGVMRNLGKTAEVIKEFEGLLKDEKYSEYRNTLNYHLASSLFHGGDYIRAEKLLEEIINSVSRSENRNIVINSYKTLGHIFLIRGNYFKAVSYYEMALNDETNTLDKFEVLCNLVLLSAQSAEYAKAKAYFEELEEIFSRFPTPVYRIPFLLAKQAYLFESGDFDYALSVMTEINDIAKSLNHKQYLYLSYRLMTECCYYKNENEKAIEYYNLAAEYAEKENILKKHGLEVSRAQLLKIRGEEQEKIFLEAYKYYKENSLLYNAALVGYNTADFYYREDIPEGSIKFFNECIETCKVNGYSSFLIREYRFNNSLLENNINGKWKDYIQQIKDKAAKALPS